MKKRIQISILPMGLLKAGDNSLEADDFSSMYEVTPGSKQPRMFNQYSHKAGECFESKADYFFPAAHSCHEADPQNAAGEPESSLENQQQISCILHLTHDSATP